LDGLAAGQDVLLKGTEATGAPADLAKEYLEVVCTADGQLAAALLQQAVTLRPSKEIARSVLVHRRSTVAPCD
jgi:hypothetical protein